MCVGRDFRIVVVEIVRIPGRVKIPKSHDSGSTGKASGTRRFNKRDIITCGWYQSICTADTAVAREVVSLTPSFS